MIDEKGATIVLVKEDKKIHIEGDTVIMSVGFRAKPSLAEGLKGTNIEFYQVGDGVSVGDVCSTIHSAFEIGRRL